MKRTYFWLILTTDVYGARHFCARLGVRLRGRSVSRKREMGKLSSFFRGCWRAGGLALIIGLAAVLVVGDSAVAKSRRDRFNDRPWGNPSPDSGRDNNARGSSDAGSSARGNSSSGGSASNSSKANNGKSDKANDKKDKNAKAKDGDDDDDDGRSGAQRDAGKPLGKTGGGGKGKADAPEPPKTVVEMLQRMFPANASGAAGDGKSSIRTDDSPGKAGDSHKGPKANAPSQSNQGTTPTPARSAAADTAQAKR